jgi:hypothetical protein
MKNCPQCNIQFDHLVKHSYLCVSCTSENARWRHIKATYGITKEEYLAMFKSQNGQCAICNTTETNHSKMFNLIVDHKHDETHRRGTRNKENIRGLLCSNCNHGLGQFKDDPNLLQSAINYLKSHTG